MAKKKRSAIAAVITAFVMAFTIVPIGSGPAFANEAMSGTCGAGGAVTYSWDGQGTLRIEGNGPMDDMESMWLEPWETKWKEAVPLDEIRTIIIGDGITYIGKYCFEKAGVTQLSIGKSVQEIGEGAFQSCSNLEDVAIPDSVAEIGPMAFSNDQSLRSVTFGSGIRSIGVRAFEQCALTHVMIPRTLTSIGEGAFSQCEKLDTVIVPSNMDEIEVVQEGALTDLYDGLFEDSFIGTVTFETGLKSIPDYFLSGAYIRTVEIPLSVTHIGNSALENWQTSYWNGEDYEDTPVQPLIRYPGTKEQFLTIGMEFHLMHFFFEGDTYYYLYDADYEEGGPNHYTEEMYEGGTFVKVECAGETGPEDPEDPEEPDVELTVKQKDFLDDHLEFIESGRYNEQLGKRYSKSLRDSVSKDAKPLVQMLYNVMKSGSELTQCKSLSVFKNPYDAVIVDILMAEAGREQLDYELDVLSNRAKIADKLYGFFKNAYEMQHDLEAGTWEPAKEYKTYVEKLLYDPPADMQKDDPEFFKLFNDTLGTCFEDEKQLNDFLAGYDKVRTGVKAINAYSNVAEWVYECGNYLAAAKAYINSSEEFKKVLEVTSEQWYEDETIENDYYRDLYREAVKKYSRFADAELTETQMAMMVADEFFDLGVDHVLDVFGPTVADQAKKYLQVGLGLTEAQLATFLLYLEAYNTGMSLGDAITGNDKIFDYQEEIRAWFHLSEAMKMRANETKAQLLQHPSLQNALYFDKSYTIMQKCEVEILDAYGKLLSCYIYKDGEEQKGKKGMLWQWILFGNYSKLYSDLQLVQGYKLEWATANCHDDGIQMDDVRPSFEYEGDIVMGYVAGVPVNVYVCRIPGSAVCMSVEDGGLSFSGSGIAASAYEGGAAFALRDRETYQVLVEPQESGHLCYSELRLNRRDQTAVSTEYRDLEVAAGEQYIFTQSAEGDVISAEVLPSGEQVLPDENLEFSTNPEDYADPEEPDRIALPTAKILKIKQGKSVKNGRKSVTVKWKKLSRKKRSRITGFRIQFSTSKKFKKKATHTVTVKGRNKTAKVIKKLKQGKKYYFRICTYKKSGGKKIYSPWSGKMAVRIK